MIINENKADRRIKNKMHSIVIRIVKNRNMNIYFLLNFFNNMNEYFKSL